MNTPESAASATAATAATAATTPTTTVTSTTAAAATGNGRHAVVIGSGVAGLMSAWALHRKGWQVTVLEKGANIGGAVQTVHRDGYQVECGPNTMMVTSKVFEQALQEIGLLERAIRPNTSFKKRFLVRGGKLNAGPAGFGDFAKTPLFSPWAKFRLFWNLIWGAKRRKDLEDESLGSFFRRQFGNEVVDWAIRPVITGVYAGDADRLSLRHAFPFVWEASRRSRSVLRGVILNLLDKRKTGTGFRNYMIDFEGGLHTLPQTLAATLPIAPVTGATVTGVEMLPQASGNPRWKVSYAVAAAPTADADSSAAVQTLEADALVLAAPAAQVASLPLPPEVAQKLGVLSAIEYPPLVNVALGYNREQISHPLDGFGAVVPELEKAKVLGVLFSSSVFPQVAPEGKVLLTTFIGGTRAPELTQLDPQALVKHTHEQLRELLGIEGEPQFSNTAYWPRAIPQVTLGYERYLDAMDSAEQSWPSLAIVGNYRGEIALGKCAADAFTRTEALVNRVTAG